MAVRKIREISLALALLRSEIRLLPVLCVHLSIRVPHAPHCQRLHLFAIRFLSFWTLVSMLSASSALVLSSEILSTLFFSLFLILLIVCFFPPVCLFFLQRSYLFRVRLFVFGKQMFFFFNLFLVCSLFFFLSRDFYFLTPPSCLFLTVQSSISFFIRMF